MIYYLPRIKVTVTILREVDTDVTVNVVGWMSVVVVPGRLVV